MLLPSDPYLSELLKIEETMPEKDKTGKLINWEQKTLICGIVSKLLQQQTSNGYMLKSWKNSQELTTLFQNFKHKPEADLLALSRSLEP